MRVSALRTRLTAALAVLASAVMALAMFAGVARADDAAATAEANCSVTVTDATAGQTYRIYKIFDVTTDGEGAYNYTMENNDTSQAFVKAIDASSLKGLLTTLPDATYCQVDTSKLNAETAKSVLVGIIKQSIKDGVFTEAATAQTATGNTVTFENLYPGYYFVSTTTGTLCSLGTTVNDATVEDKNSVPTLTKGVRFVTSAYDTTAFPEEDEFSSSTSAGIGDTVEYKVAVILPEGSTNIALHDVFPTGVTFAGTDTGFTVTDNNGTALVAGTDYTVTAPGNTTTFDLELTETGLGKVNGTEGVNGGFVVTYRGTLNSDAVVGGSAGNPNKAYLTYGESSTKSTEASATVMTYMIQVKKLDGDSGKALADAVFAFSTTDSSEGVIKFNRTSETTTGDVTDYLADPSGEFAKITTDANGTFTLSGLKAGTYHLAELESPAGYNPLTTSKSVDVDQDTNGSTITINNYKGSILPVTGGIGTTIFYVVGGVLVVGAVVALVAKKKMSANK